MKTLTALIAKEKGTFYSDLPDYARRQDWYNLAGSDVKVIIPHPVWRELLGNAYSIGSQNEAGFVLAGYQLSPNKVLVADHEFVSKGNTDSIRSGGREYLDAAFGAIRRSNPIDQVVDRVLKFPASQKLIVGGMHTHPGHGVFLSHRDINCIKTFMDFAKKHPSLYAENYGNLELVVDPCDKRADAFKLSPKGYEPVSVYVKNLEEFFG